MIVSHEAPCRCGGFVPSLARDFRPHASILDLDAAGNHHFHPWLQQGTSLSPGRELDHVPLERHHGEDWRGRRVPSDGGHRSPPTISSRAASRRSPSRGPQVRPSVPGSRVAMANAGLQIGRGTNGSQFFITTVPTTWLNGKHTIFGEVADDESKRVVDAIEAVPTVATTSPRGCRDHRHRRRDPDQSSPRFGERLDEPVGLLPTPRPPELDPVPALRAHHLPGMPGAGAGRRAVPGLRPRGGRLRSRTPANAGSSARRAPGRAPQAGGERSRAERDSVATSRGCCARVVNRPRSAGSSSACADHGLGHRGAAHHQPARSWLGAIPMSPRRSGGIVTSLVHVRRASTLSGILLAILLNASSSCWSRHPIERTSGARSFLTVLFAVGRSSAPLRMMIWPGGSAAGFGLGAGLFGLFGAYADRSCGRYPRARTQALVILGLNLAVQPGLRRIQSFPLITSAACWREPAQR